MLEFKFSELVSGDHFRFVDETEHYSYIRTICPPHDIDGYISTSDGWFFNLKTIKDVSDDLVNILPAKSINRLG